MISKASSVICCLFMIWILMVSSAPSDNYGHSKITGASIHGNSSMPSGPSGGPTTPGSPLGAGQNHSNRIRLGSSLSPNTSHNSWLSPSGLFAFGFYPKQKGFAVGIWLASNPTTTVVWTANRDDPPVSSNTTLEFTKHRGLFLWTRKGEGISITDELDEDAVSASMLDTGNFVIYNNQSNVTWQSFDYPTDTLLGSQYLDYGEELLSSASTTDQSSGRFHLIMQKDANLVAYPVNSSDRPEDSYWNSNTVNLGGRLNLTSRGLLCLSNSSSGVCMHTLVNSSYSGNNKKIIYRATLDADGIFRLYSHSFGIRDNSTGLIQWSALGNRCDVKGICGVNSFCLNTDTIANCSCFPGFTFLHRDKKFLGCYQSFIDQQGCTRRDPTSIYNITVLRNTQWTGYPYSVILTNKEEDCGRSCQEDCNCWAALYLNDTCKKHKLPLLYVVSKPNTSITGFIKIGHNSSVPESNPSNSTILAVILGCLAFFCSVIAIYSFFIYRRRRHRYKRLSENGSLGLNSEFTMRSFSYSELVEATDGFKEELGRNSFGAVYKGAISDAEGKKLIAVKRIERDMEEGKREFRAEMTAIGRTHHRNLVQLLGFCIEGASKLLVYEFMKNGSLANLLFKVEMHPSWKERVKIAMDVARGILYLHEECETRIIHCNIKPQNILMDDSWTAKISDFGLAKLLMPNQIGTLTGIRGTRGYLAPEWHRNTLISEKADIYSFGVVLLEIICCRSNMEVSVSTADEILLIDWVYNCFVAGELEKVVGDEEVDMKTLERMVKVGLLCIQDDPSLRPSMKNVILMLEGTMDIPVSPSSPPSVLPL
ncbi:G-type lectin S-receptor-like serine/threonine-protein kinase LECRK2 [Cornus florida]|uniref:G-type lectin S-receptor-like serine/threonine-protein kinase LECRK2 n=1 Tax=Cornus florida TaxID=4283 RepID=UPI0028995753|nr:G-type lectin S-receptor-like serine/threonine-protein kinase LECRK2 [Cornus florida]